MSKWYVVRECKKCNAGYQCTAEVIAKFDNVSIMIDDGSVVVSKASRCYTVRCINVRSRTFIGWDSAATYLKGHGFDENVIKTVKTILDTIEVFDK